MSASELINLFGTVSPAGIEVPGDVPVAVFAYCEASVKANVIPDASDVPDPMQVGAVVQAGEVIYGKSAATAATVVTSSRLMKVVEVSELHGPSAAIMSIAVLFVPSARPGLPPVASR
jgi:ABC-type hemin transport system ATPase subunit